jgi:DNA polymerase III subunit gamma/tau
VAQTTLYNKWRPRTFADANDLPLVGQEAIGRTLRQAIVRNQIAHAYLFCGPRGTGKTSAARIFARAVNCQRGLQGEPCNQCGNCTALLDGRQLDLLIEIDAASNRGVDDARMLRERLLQRPGGDGLTGRYKVYIIDEVHMLTKEAFNTLLKSLEEPPPHVIFILATTDPQEVLPTILSRCQRFDFRSVALEKLVGHLEHVAMVEGFAVEPRALEALARAARGGLRDAISLLDQAMAFGGEPGLDGERRISTSQVDAMLGISRLDAVTQVARALGDQDLASALRASHRALNGGADVRAFNRQVVDFLRGVMLTLGGAPETLEVDVETRDAIGQVSRTFTLGRVIRAVKGLSGLDASLRTRTVDATLVFEVALAEAIDTPAGAAASSPPAQPPNQRVAQRADPASPDIRPERSSEARTSVRLAPADVAGENVTAQVVVERREPAAGPTPQLAPGATVDADTAIVTHDDVQTDQRGSQGAVPEDAVQSLQQVEVAPVARSTSPGLWPTAPQSAANVTAPVRRARPTGKTIGLTDVVSQWASVIAQIRDDGMVPLMGVLQGTSPIAVEPENLVIVSCGSAFAMQKLRDTTNTLGIERALSRVMGVPMRIRVVVGDGTNDGAEARRGPSGPDPFASRAVRMLGGRALNNDEVTDLDRRPTLPFDSWT